MEKMIKLSDFHPEDTLVFSVDINNGFCKEGALYSPRTEKLIPKTAETLKNVLDAGFRVIAFTDTHEGNSPEFAGYPPHCLSGTAESRLVDELEFLYEAENADVVPKNSTNGFFALDRAVLETCRNFIVTGCCTDICVHQLAVTLKTYFNQRDEHRRVIAVRDLIDTFDAPGHPAETLNDVFFASMTSNGVEVVDTITR